jgi:hypothetical protein
MERDTKILLGLAAAGVVAYLVYKSSKPKATTPSKPSSKCTGEFAVECNDGSCDVSNGKNAPCLGERGGVKGTTVIDERLPRKFPTGLELEELLKAQAHILPAVQKQPECICESYPCNCGGSKPDGYGYEEMTAYQEMIINSNGYIK